MKYFVSNDEEVEVSLEDLCTIAFDGERSADYLIGCNNVLKALIDLGLIKEVYRND